MTSRGPDDATMAAQAAAGAAKAAAGAEPRAASTAPAAPPQPPWRRALPFVLAIALVAAVLSRVDFRTFGQRLLAVDVVSFVAFTAGIVTAILAADTVATVVVYRRSVAPISLKDFFTLRGASYLPSLVNHHVGQAFVTWFVARSHAVPLWRVAGATLVAYATWVGALLGLASVAFLLNGRPMTWLVPPLGAGLVYLAILAWKPPALAKTTFLGPLFEAGVAGHLVAMVARVPHMMLLFAGTWLSFRFFGVEIPVRAAFERVPILMVVVTLPLTPQGFGTRDVTAAQLFESFAPGASPEERLAAIAAATTSWGVASTLGEVALALLLTRRATHLVSEAGAAQRATAASPRAREPDAP